MKASAFRRIASGAAATFAAIGLACTPAAQPAPTAATASKPADAAWQQIVDAAKKEGKVVVVGLPSQGLADLLTQGMKSRYPDIAFEYVAIPGQEIAPKITIEVSANKQTADVVLVGTTTAIEALIPAGAIEELPPLLVGPSSKEQSAWRGGKFTFSDDTGKFNLMGISYVKPPLVYNPEIVKDGDIKSYKDLLDPKYKGKISMLDPRLAGGGQANATFWYTHPDLGKDYLTQLFAQNITVSRDNQQLINWVAQGQYPLSIGPGELETTENMRKGLPLRHLEGDSMKEGAYVTPGAGTLVVIKGQPHPNATKVFLDFLLSKEGSTAWSQGSGYPSLRTDAPYDGPAYLVPKPGVKYQDNGTEQFVKLRKEILDFLTPMLPG